ncbi:lantibiotic dehydratase [Actinacidiphila bryophytorum]|uniref:Lant_dehydr_N domain-containing protein n=1 Tax=Actinacidiphila bryophytorum TaxID=1436133 RepID=A0A9W4GZI4_9ACTN|nr:lantibiotic dehydratase [Actinacidiphila bryophytorum]MBM9438461.1 lantibiotic dehydratase [Actinacidiphila bryophytorum]MBN6542546.1 lantibiotic dehydratase [Actinacidiphila bryophytorum]CAG7613355.1 Lant_dehydr_N domain-containing protein [Actinacidiphila bryophytorum]
MDHPAAATASQWSLLPVAFLRQAGYPHARLDGLRAPSLAPAVAEWEQAARDLAAARQDLLAVLSDDAPSDDALSDDAPSARFDEAGTRIGQGRTPRPRDVLLLRELARTRRTMRGWEAAQERCRAAQAEFRARYETSAQAGRLAVVDAFSDETLRDALLLSNDAAHRLFVGWLDTKPTDFSGPARRRVDTLTRYLQRVATKNETHAHFGPFTPGRLGRGHGLRLGAGTGPVRTVFLSHWAAQAIADAVAAHPAFRDRVRPRLHPLVFLDRDRAVRYDFTSGGSGGSGGSGVFEEWRFRRVDERTLTGAERWLLGRCDGRTPLAALRPAFEKWLGAEQPSGPALLDDLLRDLVRGQWVSSGFEIPTGTPSAVHDLRELLAEGLADAPEARILLEHVEHFLTEFAEAGPARRPALLDDLKSLFEAFTGRAANRGHGRIYADRSIVFEECRSGLTGLTVGTDMAAFLQQELAPAYDLMLIGPRLRMRLESGILHDWCRDRYEAGAEIPLFDFYELFAADSGSVARACAQVDLRLAQVEERIAAQLYGEDLGRRRVEVSAASVRELLGAYPSWPSAVINPDVMFAASGAGALAAGDFQAVIGDCHAVRDLLTHTSVAPLLAAEQPDLPHLVADHYARAADPDEEVVDLVRVHSSKTSAQVPLPLADLELLGVSRKSPQDVISPADMYVRVTDERLELRARGRRRRLRLLAAPAGSASISGDPLAVFAFPRYFGGGVVALGGRTHLPRLTCGRVVLAREQWWLPAAALAPGSGGDDAADFARLHKLRRTARLPDQLFAKVAAEPKPLYVDLDSPLLVRQLMRTARADGGLVHLMEMLPAPDRLWLDVGGARHTSELRCALFSRGQR